MQSILSKDTAVTVHWSKTVFCADINIIGANTYYEHPDTTR